MQIDNLQEFIQSIMDNNEPELELFSLSTHKKFAEKIINDLVSSNSEYEPIAYCFCNFALQKWCIEKREQIKIDLQTLNDAILNSDSYFGFETHKNMEFQKETLELNDSTVARIEKIIELSPFLLNKSEVRAVEDIFLNNESSKYIVCNYLKTALTKLFVAYKDEFNEILNKKNEILDAVDEEMYLTYHSADNLLYIANCTKNHVNSKLNGIDFKDTYETVKRTIELLGSCPFKDDLKFIIMRHFNGNTVSSTAELLGRSRTYVQFRKDNGLKIIEHLIWGMFAY